MILYLASFLKYGSGLAQYGAVAEMTAGFAVFVAVLCAWPARFVACVSLALVAVIAGAGLYDVCRGAAPLAGLMNVNHFGCFIAVALPVVLGMALHSARRQRRVQAGVLALFVVLLLFLLVASKCRTALAVSTLIMLGMGGVYAARLTFCGGFVILYAHAELLAGIIGTGDIRAV